MNQRLFFGISLSHTPYQRLEFHFHEGPGDLMVLGFHQPFCDVSPQGQNQQMGYASCDLRGFVYPLSDGA